MQTALDLIEAGPLPHSHSNACVVVDEAGAAEVELSFFDYQRQAYICGSGHSPEPFFFPARQRTLADGRTGYVVGSEVTRFLRRDARIRVASRDSCLGDVRCKVRTYGADVASGSRIGFGRVDKAPATPPASSPSPAPQPPEPLRDSPNRPTGSASTEPSTPSSTLMAPDPTSARAGRGTVRLLTAGVLFTAPIAGFLLWNGSESEQQLVCAEDNLGESFVNVGLLEPCKQPARVDPEPAAYASYSQCIATHPVCEREACASAYLHVAGAGEHADVVRRNQMEATVNCSAQRDREADFATFNKCILDSADSCARRRCVDRYRSSLNVEPYLSALRSVQEASTESCNLLQDEEAYSEFNRCVSRTDPCQRDSCAEPLTERVRAGTHAQDIAQALDDARSLCRLRDVPSIPSPQQRIVNVSPSFDCSLASAPSETAICNDNQLAQLDLDLAEAYNSRLSSLVGSGRRNLIRSERDWIAYRDASCGSSKSCLASMIQGRIKQLRRY